MQVRVLKPFPYSQDGTATETLEEGKVFNVREDIREGLVAAGFIEVDDGVAAPIEKPPQVVIPDDWATYTDAKLMALAKKVAGEAPADADAAKAVISAELAARVA